MAGHIFGADEVVVVDVETTGVCFGGPRGEDAWGEDAICSLSALLMTRGSDGVFRPAAQVSGLFDPLRPVRPTAAGINGFHRSMAADEPVPAGRVQLAGRPAFRDRVGAFLDFVGGRPLVAHNARFDLAAVDRELARAGLPALEGWFACTRKGCAEMVGKDREDPYVSGTRLDDLCDALGLSRESRRGGHSAGPDCVLCAMAFARLERMGFVRLEPIATLAHRCAAPPPLRSCGP